MYDTYNVVLYINIETYVLEMSKMKNVIPENVIAHVHMKFVELAKVDDRSSDADDMFYWKHKIENIWVTWSVCGW